MRQPITQNTQQQKQINKIRCWNCGYENDEDARFCINCGASLLPIKCPKCNHINPPGSKYCGNCGYNLQQLTQQKQ